jgi:hypothetical protein
MLKYQNQRTHKPETPFTIALAFVQIGLVLLGLVGLSIHLFEDKGWLHQWLGSLMRLELVYMVIGGVVVLAGGYLFKGWLHGRDEGAQNRIANALLYVMAIVGVYFLFRLITEGRM